VTEYDFFARLGKTPMVQPAASSAFQIKTQLYTMPTTDKYLANGFLGWLLLVLQTQVSIHYYNLRMQNTLHLI
jgi:hypothetical protein